MKTLMAQELTIEVHRGGLQWKGTSLECLCNARATDDIGLLYVDAPGVGRMNFAIVEEMLVLGTALDNSGSTGRSVDHRLLRAESNYWANAWTGKRSTILSSPFGTQIPRKYYHKPCKRFRKKLLNSCKDSRKDLWKFAKNPQILARVLAGIQQILARVLAANA